MMFIINKFSGHEKIIILKEWGGPWERESVDDDDDDADKSEKGEAKINIINKIWLK